MAVACGGSVRRTALSDQRSHLPYILHAVYYLKDRGRRPAALTIPCRRVQRAAVRSNLHVWVGAALGYKMRTGFVQALLRTEVDELRLPVNCVLHACKQKVA